jgi:hypothetical protein
MFSEQKSNGIAHTTKNFCSQSGKLSLSSFCFAWLNKNIHLCKITILSSHAMPEKY